MAVACKELLKKAVVSADMTVLTGLPIGNSKEYAQMETADNVVIRDAVTKRPVIPGSMLKCKLRFLLTRLKAKKNPMQDIENEPYEIKRLFGNSSDETAASRLRFTDIFMDDNSPDEIEEINTNLYIADMLFPRQMERVPKGSRFKVCIVYNIEDETEMTEDFKNLGLSISLLHMDYIGRHGTRGYGRVRLHDFNIELTGIGENPEGVDLDKCLRYLKGAEEFAPLLVI